jgi:hypothetical protein
MPEHECDRLCEADREDGLLEYKTAFEAAERGIAKLEDRIAALEAALRKTVDWLERMCQHYDSDDTEEWKADIARVRALLAEEESNGG